MMIKKSSLFLAPLFAILTFTLVASAAPYSAPAYSYKLKDTIPLGLQGKFVDDYGIRYKINDSLWIQQPGTKFHIIEWNANQKYILAKNDNSNPTEQGLYTRIDFVMLPGMGEWTWGFCLTVYNADSATEALKVAAADRANPRKGCNGYPFSRMKNDMNAE